MKYMFLLVLLFPSLIMGLSPQLTLNEQLVNKAATNNLMDLNIKMEIKKLIDDGAEVDYVDPVHGTALAQAAKNGNFGVIRVLLYQGADPNKEVRIDGQVQVPLALALQNIQNLQNVISVQLLLAAGAKVQHPAVQELLKERPNAQQELERLEKNLIDFKRVHTIYKL